MVKDIVKDTNILSQKSERFVFGEDDYLIKDMLDTAKAHQDRCIGLACIQIGIPKKIILVKIGDKFVPMINPIILRKSTKTYVANERCLSLEGERPVKRHEQIRVGYTMPNGNSKVQEVRGLVAQIVQHECDHLNGILI